MVIQQGKALFRSRFVRNVAVVATGTAGAQAITMAFAPVITRLYGPEVFGQLGTFMAVLGIVTPLAALTYPIAIVLPKSDAEAQSIAKFSAALAVVVAAITTIILWLAGGRIAAVLNLGAIASFLLLIPVVMLFSACQQILTQWLIRKRQFKITAGAAVIQALVVNSSKAGLGLFHPTSAALIVITTIGHAFHAGLLLSGVRRSKGQNISQPEYAGTWEKLARRYGDFPLYRAPQVTLNAFSQSLPVLMLATFFGPTSAGFYALGKSVMGMPSTLIGQAVGNVFYPRITDATRSGENLHSLLLRATLAMAAIGVVPFGVVVAFGPSLFTVVFGDQWHVAGEYARWVAIWLFFGFLNRPSVAAIPALGMQDSFLLYEVVSTILRALTILVGFVIFEDDVIAIVLFSLSGVLLNASLVMFILHKSQKATTSE